MADKSPMQAPIPESSIVQGSSIGTTIPLKDELANKHEKWKRIKALIENDENKLQGQKFVWMLPNEKKTDYYKRKQFFVPNMVNMSQDLISAAPAAVYKNGVEQKFDNNKSTLAAFAEDVTQGNENPLPMLKYMRDHVAMNLRSYGTSFTIIDKPRGVFPNKEAERLGGLPYLNNIHPLDVVNYEFKDGVLLWFAYKKIYTPIWENPKQKQQAPFEIICIWTQTEFIVQKNSGEILPGLSYVHNWGFVPVIIQAAFITCPNDVLGQAAFEQTSNMIITFNNLIHLAVWEVLKHGGALLMMPEEAMTNSNFGNDESGETRLKKQSEGTVLTVAGEKFPEYLVKDLQVELIRDLAEFYRAAAIDNERDQKSVLKKGGDGVDVAQSGIAKIIDREPIEASLAVLAEDLEQFSAKVYDMVGKIMNVENDATVEFNKEYDLRPFKQRLDEIKTANEINYGKMTETGYKILYKGITPEITADLDEQAIINDEIDKSTFIADDGALEAELSAEMEKEMEAEKEVDNGGDDI